MKHFDKFRKGEIVIDEPTDNLFLQGLFVMFGYAKKIPKTALWRERTDDTITWEFLVDSLKNYPIHRAFD